MIKMEQAAQYVLELIEHAKYSNKPIDMRRFVVDSAKTYNVQVLHLLAFIYTKTIANQ